jgi:hypothetical protein
MQGVWYTVFCILYPVLVDPLAGVETNGYLVNWLTG